MEGKLSLVGSKAFHRRTFLGLGCLLVVLTCLVVSPRCVQAQESYIVINIPTFTLALYENSTLVRTYPIAVGNRFSPSRIGKTEIINKVVNPTYYPPNWYEKGLEPIPPGPDNPVGTRWLGLGFPGYGIHGTNAPGSIGKDVSLGCIRMHNADVEELATRVRIGTPVYFVYEPIVVKREVPGSDYLIAVYPDIYQRGVISLEHALEILAEAGVEGDIDTAVLAEFLHLADGKDKPVPYRTTLRWKGQELGRAVVLGEEIYVLPETLKDIVNWRVDSSVAGASPVVLPTRRLAGRNHVLLQAAANHLGAIVTGGKEGVELTTITVAAKGEEKALWPRLVDRDLLVPVEAAAALVGANVRGQGRSQYGRLQRVAAMLGAQAQWQWPQEKATIAFPTVELEGNIVGHGLIGYGEIWLPLNPIRALLPQLEMKVLGEVVWLELQGGGAGFAAWRRQEQLYVPFSKVAPLMTHWIFAWDPNHNRIKLWRWDR